MKYEQAKNLHNHDELTIKETGEITEVINTEVDEKNVFIYAMTNENGYTKLHHKEIR